MIGAATRSKQSLIPVFRLRTIVSPRSSRRLRPGTTPQLCAVKTARLVSLWWKFIISKRTERVYSAHLDLRLLDRLRIFIEEQKFVKATLGSKHAVAPGRPVSA